MTDIERKEPPPPIKQHAGLIDSVIIILISAAVDIFLLWAASQTMGIDTFEHLPSWLERAYNALWTSAATGTAGVGLAIVKALRRKADERPPNYLLLIVGTSITFLILITGLPRLWPSKVGGGSQGTAYVEAHLISGGGVTPGFMGGLPQLPGNLCGQTSINFSEADIHVRVGEWKDVNWDASYICRRQGIAGAVDGSVAWGTPSRDASTLPGAAPAYGEWGKMTFKYLQPGRYTVTMDMTANCIDVGLPPNPCRAHGQFDVTVNQ